MLQRRVLMLTAAVSALLPISAVMIVSGVGDGEPAVIILGALFGAAALFGVLALGRLVVVIGRGRPGR